MSSHRFVRREQRQPEAEPGQVKRYWPGRAPDWYKEEKEEEEEEQSEDEAAPAAFGKLAVEDGPAFAPAAVAAPTIVKKASYTSLLGRRLSGFYSQLPAAVSGSLVKIPGQAAGSCSRDLQPVRCHICTRMVRMICVYRYGTCWTAFMGGVPRCGRRSSPTIQCIPTSNVDCCTRIPAHVAHGR